ncbi:HU family DNA-binding protein [Leptothoe sp. PORK10 BA2]|uniref:HU family DNA-binding protein n=1 Tax=Leptothoe sp. PORK10 BA2 TaxID=3110254 RepID=UPI002B1FDEE2|nr:HU family DNA-binding protein [Leptothoe sp. PORK10 BA2]MEA5465268.1 HU family DNA-binding protein [Leptothoe sp. PORK10 BA2]
MNKGELVGAICDRRGVTRAVAESIISEAIDVIVQQVAQGNRVTLVGFGTFESVHAKERVGRNPRTGETLTIPERTKPIFRAGKLFKEAVNDG